MLQPRLTKVEPMPQMKLQLFYETGEVKILMWRHTQLDHGTGSFRMLDILMRFRCCPVALESSGQRGRTLHRMSCMKTALQ